MKLSPKRFIFSIVIAIAVLGFTALAGVNLIELRLSINDQDARLAEWNAQAEVLMAENAALQASIDSELTDEQIMKQARDKLGLALPGEKIFVDISN